MMYVYTLLLIVGTLLFAWNIGRIIVPYGTALLRHYAIVQKNYKENIIPTSYGFILFLAYTFVSIIISPVFVWIIDELRLFFLAVFTVSLWMVFLGWMDDTLGDQHVKGFYGHFSAFIREGIITTGLLKAVGGGGAAYLIALITAHNWLEWLVHGSVIALSTNWLNLLDLRPGRAAKFYLLFSGIVFIIAWTNIVIALFIPLFGLVAATLRVDLKAELMLGDSGANLLGIQLGVLTVTIFPLTVCTVLLVLYLFGHLYAERHSITALISKVAWLRKLDNWGRT